jgi:hypothetical protein
MATAYVRNFLAAALLCVLSLTSARAQQVPLFTSTSALGASVATGDFSVLDARSLLVYASDEPSASATAPAEGGAESNEELAKKLQNPVANLISVPLQYNADFNIGPNNATKSTLNIQPVIPITLNKDWNLITRTIVPVVYVDSTANGVQSQFGLGDTLQSFFFSPAEGEVIWGVGPAFLWPTATNDLLGSGKWGVGPTAVVLKQTHGWTFGMLANQIWSYAGASDRESVNSTFLQPFIGYTLPTYTTFTINTESTYSWSARQWTVPINLTVSQLLKIGHLPIQFQLGPRYYAESPPGGPRWGLRFTTTFLFPK